MVDKLLSMARRVSDLVSDIAMGPKEQSAASTDVAIKMKSQRTPGK